MVRLAKQPTPGLVLLLLVPAFLILSYFALARSTGARVHTPEPASKHGKPEPNADLDHDGFPDLVEAQNFQRPREFSPLVARDRKSGAPPDAGRPDSGGRRAFAVVGNLNLDYADRAWSNWYSAREFRDRRTLFFLDRFDGDATFQYAIRVQIPGEFVVAPARAELMYQPATHANTATNRFSFIDRKH